MARIELDGGKYTVINDNGILRFERHGEPWQAAVDQFSGAGVVLAMVHEIEHLREHLAIRGELLEAKRTTITELRARLDEVHSWILSPASPNDLMQNALRIEQVTDIAQPFHPKE